MRLLPVPLAGLLCFEPQVFGDERGFFQEIWNRERYAGFGLDKDFVQDNIARSQRGVLRGLHFQNPNAQGKLVWALQGEVFDVTVDIRRSSPTFGQWFGIYLSAANHRQLYVPPGFAHGYAVTSETVLFAYKCTDFYRPATQQAVRWNDPAIGIKWPIGEPILSPKDQAAPLLAELPPDRLFP
jgi:dTDP-4-dehydrorhamnose 3,5-epimerase